MSTRYENSTGIEAPFVIISKKPIEDPYAVYDKDDENFILLKTEDGTLISFRESWADSEGGSNTGVVIELFDPNNLFIQQFIDNNIVKGFTGYAKTKKGITAFEEAYTEVEKVFEGDVSGLKTSINTLAKLEEQLYEIDHKLTFFGKSAKARRRRKLVKEIDELEKSIERGKNFTGNFRTSFTIDNEFYITYGFGTDKSLSPSRAFTFSMLEYAHESGRQGVIKLEFVHNKGQSERAAFERAEAKRRLEHSNNTPGSTFKGSRLLEMTADVRASRRVFDSRNDIVFHMEYTLQEFLKSKTTSTAIPLVFLSPQVLPNLIAKIKEAEAENSLKESIPTRTGDPWSKMLKAANFITLRHLLRKFGFKLDNRGSWQGTNGGNGTFYNLAIKKSKVLTPVDQVINIINNIYRELEISQGSDIVNKNILNPIHSKAFLENFLDPPKHSNTLRREVQYKAIPKKLNMGQDEGILYRVTNSIDLSKDTRAIHCIGDGYFIEGVLFNLPYAENENIFREFDKGTPGSNIHRFMSRADYEGYAKILEATYVEPVRRSGRFDLPDEYAKRLAPSVANRIRDKVPTFLSNVENSNVISFVATHKKEEFKTLTSDLVTLFEYIPFESYRDDDGKKKAFKLSKSLNDEQISSIALSIIDAEYKNSTNLKSMFAFISEAFDPKNSETAKSYQKVLDALRLELEGSTLITNHNISPNAMRLYLLYLQKLSFNYTRIQAKTTPMFSISSDYWINKPVLFLHKKLYNPTPEPHSTSLSLNTPSPFSGMYKLLGLEHVITSSECYSSFSIHKIPLATAEVEKAEITNP
jgi:hypothetical protein